MKKSRFTESQIVAIPKEGAARVFQPREARAEAPFDALRISCRRE